MSESDFSDLLRNALGLPLLAVFSFAIAIATLVLAHNHGLSWTDTHRVGNQDPKLRNKLFISAGCGIFAFFFLVINNRTFQQRDDLALIQVIGVVVWMASMFSFLRSWDKFVKLAKLEKAKEGSSTASEATPETLYDKLKSLRKRAAQQKSDC